MGKSWNKVEYKKGDIIGSCEFIEEREPWHGERMGVFKCLEDGCGREFITRIRSVRNSRTKSCGCLGPNKLRKSTIERNTIHGMSGTYFYSRWGGIKSRCYSKGNPVYWRYGGRGITMYEPWILDFTAFYNYIKSLDGFRDDIKGYGLTLDRIDVNGNYEPGNIRWATPHIQATNKNLRIDDNVGFAGVHRRDGKFRSGLTVNRQRCYFGTFDTPEQAAMARDMFIVKSGLWEYPLQAMTSNNLTR